MPGHHSMNVENRSKLLQNSVQTRIPFIFGKRLDISGFVFNHPKTLTDSGKLQIQQGVQCVANGSFVTNTRPSVEYLVVSCNQERNRLIGHSVETEDFSILVQGPVELARLEKPGCLLRGIVVGPLPRDRNESDVISVLLGDLINDGQLPSTC